jgi:tape measure domain-containing protein
VIDRKEIELLIRAQLKGGRELTAITKSIGDLQDAIERQSEAAKKGERAFDGLKAAQEGLKAVQDELGGRSKAIQGLDALNKKIADQSARIATARQKLEDYLKTLSDDRTEKQQARVQALTKSYESAQSKLDAFKRSSESLNAALQSAGVNTSDLSAAQRATADASLRAAEAQNRVNKELIEYNENVTKGRAAAAALAEQQAKLARLQAGNETDARAGRQQAAQQAAQQAVDAAARAAAEQARQQALLARFQTGNETDARAGRLQAAEQKLAADALRKTADAAEETARQYATLARGSQNLRPKIVSLRDALDAIRNPAAASVQTLDGVEKAIQGIAATIGQSKGQVADYADQFRNLQAAQKAISTQAGLIDAFRNQLQALRDTRAEFVAARAQVTQYAAAVRQGGDAAVQFTKPLAEAQARLKQAANAMRDQVAATRESRDALRNAGINSRDLASAQQRLVEATRGSTAALKQLGEAAESNAQSVTKSAKGFSLFRDEGRTTLSFVQRLRGEILALTTAYFGVQGAISLASDSLKAFTQNQGLQSSLAFALGGDPAQVGAEIQYVRDQAERLGISFEQASKGYAKFAAAAIKSGASVQETRFIFESFSEVARVINLTPDELNGLFNAIGQSFSKGKIQAEELRQQIGERLPGAFAFAQEALKKDFPDLNKALEEGKVGAENFLTIAESIRRAASGQVGQAIKTLDAEQQRFNNSVLFFKQQIAEAGFADAYVALLKQITEFFKSEDGKKFAADIGSVAAAIASGLSSLITYRDEIALIAQVIGALVGAGLMFKFGAQITAAAAALQAAGVATALFSSVTLTLATGVAALTATLIRLGAVIAGTFLAGYSFGSYLRDQSQEVRIFGIALVTGFAELWSKIKFGALELFEELPRYVGNALKTMINLATQGFRDLLRVFQIGANALGMGSLGDTLGRAIDTLTLKVNSKVSDRVKTIRAEAAADLKRIRDIGESMLADEVGAVNTRQGSVRDRSDSRLYRDRPLTKRPNTLPAGDGDAKKRQNEIDAISKALDDLDAKALKKQGESLDSLLKAVDLQYKELGDRIAKIGGPTGKQFAERFRQGIADLKTEIAKDFNDKLLAEQTALQSKLEQLEVQAGKKQKNELQGRLDAIRTAQEQTYRDIAALQTRLVQAGQPTGAADEMKRRVDAAVLELQNIERQKIAREQLTTLEKQYNETIKVRDDLIAAVRAQQDVGAIDDVQAAQQINSITQDSLPKILEAAQATRDWAEAYFAIFGGDPAQVSLFLSSLDASIAKVRQIRTEFTKLEQTAINGAIQAIDVGLNSMYDNLVKVVDGQQSLADGFKNAGVAFLQFAAQFLREIAIMIIKQAIFNALKNSGNLYLRAVGEVGSASMKHSGGVVGAGSSVRSRAVRPEWFINAPRYHSGGIAGMAPDEYATILKKNEEVLTQSDPRNVLNGGGMGAPSAAPKSTRFVLVDDQRRVAEAMNTPEGEEAFMINLRKNIPTIRQLVKG